MVRKVSFIRMLLNFTERVDTDDFYIRIPIPEAFFVHKLIIANRRTDRSKRGKDLAQCRSLSGILDDQTLREIANSEKLGPRTKKQIQISCETIDFPYQQLGIWHPLVPASYVIYWCASRWDHERFHGQILLGWTSRHCTEIVFVAVRPIFF